MVRTPVQIAAQRLVSSPNGPCRIIVGDIPNLYFTSINTSDHTLTVPLEFTSLNSLFSPTGLAIPPSLFAPGTSGFSIPESYFRGPTGLDGMWRFLGQTVNVPSVAPMCADAGLPGQCSEILPEVLTRPFDFTRSTVFKLTRRANAAARAARWKSQGGAIARAILSRGGKAMRYMRDITPESTDSTYVCESAASACVTVSVDKAALLKYFKQIYPVNLPRGLRHLNQDSARDIQTFRKIIKELPESYVRCK